MENTQMLHILKVKGQALGVPGSWGSKISRKSAQECVKIFNPTYRPPFTPQQIFQLLISARGWVRTQVHGAAGRIKSKRNSNNTIGKRALDLLDCSAVPQPTATTRAPFDSSRMSRTRCEICWQLNSDCIYTITQSTPTQSGDEVDQTDHRATRSCTACS